MSAAVGQATPFTDSSDYNALEFQIQRVLDDVQTMTVVEVLAVNSSAQTVDVVVLVNLLSGAGISVPHGKLAGRPYYRLQGGTSGIICDPAVGDIGIMVFASRDLSAVISARAAANPASGRRFSWSDGIYLGGVLNTPPTQYIQFASGGINIVSAGTVAVTSAAFTVSGSTTLTGAVTNPGGMTVGSPTGGTAAPGTINATGLFVNGVAVATGGTPGSGTVTSVGISSTNLVTGGGPITGSGTLTVALTSAQVTDIALGASALQSVTSSSTYFSGAGTSSSQLTLASAFVAALAATATEASTALQPVTGLAGSYTSANITLNADGQITAASNGSGGSSAPSVYGIYSAPSQTGWTFISPNGLTTIQFDSDGALSFLHTASTTQWDAAIRTCPSGDFDVRALVTMDGAGVFAFFVRDSTTGNTYSFGGGSASQNPFYCLELSSPAGAYASFGYVSTPGSNSPTGYFSLNSGQMPAWFRLTRTSGVYAAYLSFNGEVWQEQVSGISGYVSSPNEIAVAMVNNSSASNVRVLAFTGA